VIVDVHARRYPRPFTEELAAYGPRHGVSLTSDTPPVLCFESDVASEAPAHRPRTTSIPLITWTTFLGGSLATRSARNARSTAMICDIFATTESFWRPVALAVRRTFPGARA